MNVNNLFTVIVRTDSGLVSMLLMCEQGIWSYANTHVFGMQSNALASIF